MRAIKPKIDFVKLKEFRAIINSAVTSSARQTVSQTHEAPGEDDKYSSPPSNLTSQTRCFKCRKVVDDVEFIVDISSNVLLRISSCHGEIESARAKLYSRRDLSLSADEFDDWAEGIFLSYKEPFAFRIDTSNIIFGIRE